MANANDYFSLGEIISRLYDKTKMLIEIDDMSLDDEEEAESASLISGYQDNEEISNVTEEENNDNKLIRDIDSALNTENYNLVDPVNDHRWYVGISEKPKINKP